MNNQLLALLGIASAIVTIAGFIPYINSILKRKTKPERASWWIWTILMVITLAVQIKQGSTWSLCLTGTYLIANIVIATLSVKYGYGKFELKDKLSLAAALLGIVLWHFSKNPTMALLVIIAIDFIGNVLTYQKTWKSPETENLFAWLLISSGAFLGLLSVGNLSSGKAIFPLYVTIVNSITVLIIMIRRHHSDTMH